MVLGDCRGSDTTQRDQSLGRSASGEFPSDRARNQFLGQRSQNQYCLDNGSHLMAAKHHTAILPQHTENLAGSPVPQRTRQNF